MILTVEKSLSAVVILDGEIHYVDITSLDITYNELEGYDVVIVIETANGEFPTAEYEFANVPIPEPHPTVVAEGVGIPKALGISVPRTWDGEHISLFEAFEEEQFLEERKSRGVAMAVPPFDGLTRVQGNFRIQTKYHEWTAAGVIAETVKELVAQEGLTLRSAKLFQIKQPEIAFNNSREKFCIQETIDIYSSYGVVQSDKILPLPQATSSPGMEDT